MKLYDAAGTLRPQRAVPPPPVCAADAARTLDLPYGDVLRACKELDLPRWGGHFWIIDRRNLKRLERHLS